MLAIKQEMEMWGQSDIPTSTFFFGCCQQQKWKWEENKSKWGFQGILHIIVSKCDSV